MDFHEIYILIFFEKSVDKIQFSLKSDKNNVHVTRRPMYIYDTPFKFFLEWEKFRKKL